MVRTINIVAIGNSLTVGFSYTIFTENWPYTQMLKELVDIFLKKSGKNMSVDVTIINKGITGDLTRSMFLRFRRDVINLKPDYVIILGGTNDIGWGFSAESIFTNIKRMFDAAMVNRIEPIGCTVPSVLGWDEGIPPILELNNLIKRFCRENNLFCVDLFKKTCDPEMNRLIPDLSSDGLHFNESGYRKMAKLIFKEAVKSLLIRELKIS